MAGTPQKLSFRIVNFMLLLFQGEKGSPGKRGTKGRTVSHNTLVGKESMLLTQLVLVSCDKTPSQIF